MCVYVYIHLSSTKMISIAVAWVKHRATCPSTVHIDSVCNHVTSRYCRSWRSSCQYPARPLGTTTVRRLARCGCTDIDCMHHSRCMVASIESDAPSMAPPPRGLEVQNADGRIARPGPAQREGLHLSHCTLSHVTTHAFVVVM